MKLKILFVATIFLIYFSSSYSFASLSKSAFTQCHGSLHSAIIESRKNMHDRSISGLKDANEKFDKAAKICTAYSQIAK